MIGGEDKASNEPSVTSKSWCFSPKTSARAGALCCDAMSKSEVPSKFCLLIIFSCYGGAERVLVRAFAGDEARPLGPVLG